MKKNNIKEVIIISSVLVFLLFLFILLYTLSVKYDDVEILSVRKEYNLVFDDTSDTIGIPLYIEKKNTFLSESENVSQVSIENEGNKFVAYLERIEEGCSLEYNSKKYYEYIYHLSFSSYDNFKEPVFLSDASLNISYTNNKSISVKIGNLNLYFNSQISSNKDLIVTKLSSVTNVVDGKETVVGLNIALYNNSEDEINIENIKINNKYYELDYMNYESATLDPFTNLKERSANYSYTQISIPTGSMNVTLNSKETFTAFIPVKYTKDIYIVDRLPLYVNYSVKNAEKQYVLDDFQFMSIAYSLNYNGVEKYVYSYR